jgi:Ca-activated chloride channel family protein
MTGFPHDTSLALLRRIVSSILPTDYFNILAFAGGSSVFSPTSLAATTANVDNGIAYVYRTSAGGATLLLQALTRALALPRALPNAARTVVILTDGIISMESLVFKLVRDNLDNSNFFAFSIGPSPNRYLTEGIATVGRGLEYWVKDAAFVEPYAVEFLSYALRPLISNVIVTIDPAFKASELLPLPSTLLAERPLLICGKYSNPLPNPGAPLFTVSGVTADGQPWSSTVLSPMTLPEPRENRALPYLWARAIIEDLRFTSDTKEIDIVPVALKYNLLTEFTSFLAVDQVVRFNRTAVDVLQIDQPIPLPEGLNATSLGLNNDQRSTEVTSFPPPFQYNGGYGRSISGPRTEVTILPLVMAAIAIIFIQLLF